MRWALEGEEDIEVSAMNRRDSTGRRGGGDEGRRVGGGALGRCGVYLSYFN